MRIRPTLLYIFLLLFISCNQENTNTSRYNVVRITATEFNYEMPDTIAAGYNLIRLINTGILWHEAAIFKFTSDTFSIHDYMDSVNKGIDFPLCSTDIGGPGMTIPKDSNEVILNLTPGKYGIICTIDNHMMAGMSKEFYVTNKNVKYNEPPKDDIVLIQTDTGFTFSKPVSPGMHLIKVINKGQQNHEVDFIKLNEGKTKDDYIKWFHNRNADPSGIPVGGTLDIIPGAEVWLPIKLEIGNYYLSCMVPDAVTGKAHLDMGINGNLEVK